MAKIDLVSLDVLEKDELTTMLHNISNQLTESFDTVPENAKAYLDAVEELDKAWAEDKDNELIAADTAADMAWKDFNAFLEGMINYPVTKICSAVGEIKFVFDPFGDPTDLPYEQEYDVLERLIAALEAIPAETRKDSLADPLIEQLKQRWSEFMKLFKMYESTDHLQKFFAIKDAKAKVNREYRELMETWNANLRIEATEQLESFASQVNDIISAPITRKNVRARTRKLSD